MRLSDNRTGELWRDFMPRRKEIKNSVNADLFSIEIYDRSHFEIMGEKYKLNDPNSEEEVWIPIKMKE
jgi:AraC family transcriptional regulator